MTMEQLKERFNSADTHVKINLVMMIVWSILFIPTMLLWKESVTWIVLMSWYANFVGHISAFVAAKAEAAVDNDA